MAGKEKNAFGELTCDMCGNLTARYVYLGSSHDVAVCDQWQSDGWCLKEYIRVATIVHKVDGTYQPSVQDQVNDAINRRN